MTTPTIDRPPVRFPTLDPSTKSLWNAVLDIAQRYPDDWSLIGGQMVFLHAIEAGALAPRVSLHPAWAGLDQPDAARAIYRILASDSAA